MALRRSRTFGSGAAPGQRCGRELAELALYLKEESISAGHAAQIWTLSRIGAPIDGKFAVQPVQSSLWRPFRATGWSARPAVHLQPAQLSVIAATGAPWVRFRLFNGSIKAPQIATFPRALYATIGRKR